MPHQLSNIHFACEATYCQYCASHAAQYFSKGTLPYTDLPWTPQSHMRNEKDTAPKRQIYRYD